MIESDGLTQGQGQSIDEGKLYKLLNIKYTKK